MLRKQLLDSARGRLVARLQRGPLTVEDLALELGLTANGVRAQLAVLERDGVVRRAGQRPGTTRPFHVFELTPEVEQLLSRAYVPLLAQLVRAFSEDLPGDQLVSLLRRAGQGLAEELAGRKGLPGNLPARISAAAEMMNEHLGALTRVERNGGYKIRGDGCPLAALTGKHPAVCLAMESFVETMVGAPVHECCLRAGRPRCCFEIQTGRGRPHR
jgi:DeoR family transcriptional regulator, suf operon transcriptional repressor